MGLHAARLPAAFALGAATAFFLDPRDGKRRRHVVRDRALRAARQGGRLLGRRAKFFAGRARGLAAGARTAVAPPQVATDDATVKQRILSDALRDAGVSTSDVEVDVHDGVATLHGSLASKSLADDLISRVREVPGVRDVNPDLLVSYTRGDLDQGI